MPFNHYAKIKRILTDQAPGWYIKYINKPTSAKTFSGEIKKYDHYYRIFDNNDNPIKYCKFQQIDKLASIMQKNIEELPIVY